MKPDSACLQEELHDWLLGCGFSQHSQAETGCVYHRESDSTCLLIDTVICRLADYPYVAYTTTQNKFVFSYDRVFRFLFDEDDLLSALQEEISLFLDGDSDPETIRRFGGNRTEQEPDPTLPEATFEDCFLQAFGDRARMGLHREFAYIDLDGVTRYIDYALFSSSAKFAIELNGESWHHPVMIGPNRYRSQLFKQNSLVADGFRVFRWSLNGMRDRERFILELQRFLGGSRPFLDKSIIKVSAALGLRNILEHFTPTHLLGVTATPERFDQQRLEKNFR